MYARLYNHVDRPKSKIIFHTQHGFQPGHSPYMSLLGMQDKISSAIENNEYAMGIFFDLAKAFDTVDHNILLKSWMFMGYEAPNVEGLFRNWKALDRNTFRE